MLGQKLLFYEKLLLHYNTNVFKGDFKRRDLAKTGDHSIIEISKFTEKLIFFITSLPEEVLIYIPERKGFRLLSKELDESNTLVRTEKIIPGSFTNPSTDYFLDVKDIFYLNQEYHKNIIKEHRSAGGRPFSLSLPSPNIENNLIYNHRSVKSMLVFFYLFLILKKDYKLSFIDYAAKIKKQEILFMKEGKIKIPSFISLQPLNEN